jgi:peptide-methionine (S)-S-oxide reductase
MTTEKAILAGGCFWGMQDLIRKLPGVVSTRVGYTGGDVQNATYRNHHGHAEAIEIIYDPAKTTYRDLLEFFFQIHDPSTKNRQGNDIGTSYRSAIFYLNDEQKRVAEDTIADVDASGLWPGKVVTEVTPAGAFWEAEPEHQDYLEHYPNGYTCHYPRPGWKLPHRADSFTSCARRGAATAGRRPTGVLSRTSGARCLGCPGPATPYYTRPWARSTGRWARSSRPSCCRSLVQGKPLQAKGSPAPAGEPAPDSGGRRTGGAAPRGVGAPGPCARSDLAADRRSAGDDPPVRLGALFRRGVGEAGVSCRKLRG